MNESKRKAYYLERELKDVQKRVSLKKQQIRKLQEKVQDLQMDLDSLEEIEETLQEGLDSLERKLLLCQHCFGLFDNLTEDKLCQSCHNVMVKAFEDYYWNDQEAHVIDWNLHINND